MTSSPGDTVPPAPPPATGHPGIDAALAALTLGPDVATHAGEIAAVLDVVQQALHAPVPEPPAPR